MNRESGLDIGLRKLVLLRIIVSTLILASGAILYFLKGDRSEAFYLLGVLATFYFLNLIFLLFDSQYINKRSLFKYVMILTDLILTTIVIYITGGVISPFIFLFPLIIIFSSILISRFASYLSAFISIFVYIATVISQLIGKNGNFQLNDLLSSEFLIGDYDLFSIFFHIIGFLLIATLGGYISERLNLTRKELGESKKSLIILQNLYENILQSLTSGVVTLDLDERVISINKSGLEILHLESEDNILSSSFGNFISGFNINDLIEKRRDQISYFSPKGQNLILGLSASLLKDDEGNTQGYTVIFQDLTEIRDLEQKLESSEKMALLGQMAGGLAHELRNPLSAISGAIEILNTEVKQNETTYRLSKVAGREIERLNLIVEDFLLLTRQSDFLNTSLVDISTIIKDTVDSFQNTVKRDNIKIRLDLHKGVLVEADSYRLKQAFWNLLDNSMDSLPNGGEIDIECYNENSKAKISFVDNGSGINEENISKIFDPFFTTKEIGTGLGLAIVQKVIEGYNGNVSVLSNKGEGTRFIVSLPRPDIQN